MDMLEAREETVENMSKPFIKPLLTDSQSDMIMLINYVFLCGLVSLLGTAGNIINMVVFYKQGLDTTINISFFAMALSDLAFLIIQQWYGIFMNPLLINSDIPIVPFDFLIYVASAPRECFARITCLITAYITAERCLCITFPLRIKQMITPRRTTVVVISTYTVMLLSVVPMYSQSYFSWKFCPEKNRTLIGLTFLAYRGIIESIVVFIHGIIASLSFLAVVVLTVILIKQLHQKTAWRSAATADQEKSEALSNRDKKTSRTVSLIATILIICYLPTLLLCVTMFLEPEFSLFGVYINLLKATWSFATLFESINSSVNILLYLRMSSKYRQTFLELFAQCCRCVRHTPVSE